MGKPQIALQLYTVRTLINNNFDDIVRQVAEMGYQGVEVAGFPGTTPAEAAKLFSSLGLAAPSMHSAFPVGDDTNMVLDIGATLKCQYLVSGASPDDVKTIDSIQRYCDKVNLANQNARSHGFILGLHNHWWEYGKLDGQLIYQILKEKISPEVTFQIDTYWVKTAGVDPATVVKEFGAQSPLLHMKDGPADMNNPHLPMVAVGAGSVDVPSILAASGDFTQWMIVEMDACATDIMVAVKDSLTYLQKISK